MLSTNRFSLPATITVFISTTSLSTTTGYSTMRYKLYARLYAKAAKYMSTIMSKFMVCLKLYFY
ncbi:unnamed protein product [Brugia pahangi]|uniref:Secreted protein n=1 Tax=Brugia pahangi TaxID=6280 RepID=A0A0N4TDX5_BRUPA|nr:unnamed protein product [Brugia pahangi]